MRHLIVLALLLAPFKAKADEPRFRNVFSSANGKYELRLKSGHSSKQNWSLVEKATGKVLYRVTGEFSSRTVLLSDDGVNLVAIDDYSSRSAGDDLDVLTFYRDGTKIKNYSLGELLSDVSNVQSSVSHFQWFFRPEALSIVDSRLTLRTFELVNYEFDARTGELLKRETDPVLTSDSIYVYGEVRKLGGNRYEIDVCQRVYGVVPKGGRIEFETDQADAFPTGNSYHSIVIRNGKLAAKQDVTLNSCSYRRENRLL